jgi:hypothetical protein
VNTLYNKPGWEMRVTALAALAEYTDRQRVKRRKRKRLTPAQRAEFSALQEKYPEYGAPRTQPRGSRLPKKVWKALHREPVASKRKVTLPKLKFMERQS